MKQKPMFETQDLPLFSGTPQQASDPEFTPKAEPQQLTLYDCPVCKDTGRISHPKMYGETLRCPSLDCEAIA